MQPWIGEVPLDEDTEVGMTLYYAYGTSAENEIRHDEAVQLAKKALQETYRLSEAQMEPYHVLCEAFDISGKLYGGSVWKFVFVDKVERAFYDAPQYRVVLDAKTGGTVIVEDFVWQEFRKDLEYDLKYY